jgi:hypothetical protein
MVTPNARPAASSRSLAEDRRSISLPLQLVKVTGWRVYTLGEGSLESRLPQILANRRKIMMKALVYSGPGAMEWTDVALPELRDPRDAIVRMDAVTICGTDLHI